MLFREMLVYSEYHKKSKNMLCKHNSLVFNNYADQHIVTPVLTQTRSANRKLFCEVLRFVNTLVH
jgi:hypothetical protein